MHIEPAQIWDLVNLLCVIVTGATALTAITRTRSAHPALDWALRFLNVVAGNFWRNRNADSESVPPRTFLPLIVFAALFPLGCGSVTFTPAECALLLERADLPFQICNGKEPREELEKCYRLATAGAKMLEAGCGFIPPKPPAEEPE